MNTPWQDIRWIHTYMHSYIHWKRLHTKSSFCFPYSLRTVLLKVQIYFIEKMNSPDLIVIEVRPIKADESRVWYSSMAMGFLAQRGNEMTLVIK